MSVPLLSFRMRSGYLLFLFLLVEMLTLLSNVYGDQTSASAATKLLLFGVIDSFLYFCCCCYCREWAQHDVCHAIFISGECLWLSDNITAPLSPQSMPPPPPPIISHCFESSSSPTTSQTIVLFFLPTASLTNQQQKYCVHVFIIQMCFGVASLSCFVKCIA